jgi:tetratricopeptide (TPR) repeat protein
MNKIFIIYNHKDKNWKDRLVSHFSVFEKQNILEIRDDQKIKDRDESQEEIEKIINTSTIIILMISADFLKSYFISDKGISRLIKRRSKEGLRIIPVVVNPCSWQETGWLKTIQEKPIPKKPLSESSKQQIDKDLTNLVSKVTQLLKQTAIATSPKRKTTPSPDDVYISKLPITESNLFGRDQELTILDQAWSDTQTHIISIIAAKGAGKTALVNEWLDQMKRYNYRNAEKVFGWSFYSLVIGENNQVCADTFFEAAFKFFGYEGKLPNSMWDKSRELVELIRKQPTLLILDGLDQLQYSPGPLKNGLRDKEMQVLLKDLAKFNNGLCVITTHYEINSIESISGNTIKKINLENLSNDAGIQILKQTGVKGSENELGNACKEYQGHAFALNLLGNFLATVHNGEIQKKDLIPPLTKGEDKNDPVKRIMIFYENLLKNTPELSILYLMGLFNRAAPKRAIDILREKPSIQDLTDALKNISKDNWRDAVKHLRDLKLLTGKDPDRSEILDCNPIIREYFSTKLRTNNPRAWKRANNRLYGYYKNLPDKKHLDTLEEMEPLFMAMAHSCQAGRFHDAQIEIYRNRIKRGNENYLISKLGAINSDLVALSNLFLKPWCTIFKELTEKDKSVILNYVLFNLQTAGRSREEAQVIQTIIKMNVEQKKWKNAAQNASNLSEIYLMLGAISMAVDYGRQSVELADQSDDDFERWRNQGRLAAALLSANQLSESLNLFIEAENIITNKYLFSDIGFYYCDLLLGQGHYKPVIKRAGQTLELGKSFHNLISIALDKITLGRANLLQTRPPDLNLPSKKDIGKYLKQAEHFLNEAVKELKKAGNRDLIPCGLLARAELYRSQKKIPDAWKDLEEAFDIADKGEMRLYLTDYHLEAARVINDQLSMKDYQMIVLDSRTNLSRDEMIVYMQNHFQKAVELVKETGYHRRDPELLLIEAQLNFVKKNKEKAQKLLGEAKALLNKIEIKIWDWEIHIMSLDDERKKL